MAADSRWMGIIIVLGLTGLVAALMLILTATHTKCRYLMSRSRNVSDIH